METLLVPALDWEAGQLDAPALAYDTSSSTIVLFYSLNDPHVPHNPYVDQHGGRRELGNLQRA